MTPIRTPHRLALGALAITVLSATACGADDGDGATVTSPPSTTTPSSPSLVTVPPSVPATGSAPAPAAPTETALVAVRDLADRLGIDPATIIVVSEEGVTWPDGAIGCPEPGVGYIQVITEGERIVLEAEDTQYEYHAGGGRDPFLCENPQPPIDG